MDHGITHYRSQSLIDFACKFADDAHSGQVRKYTGEPYIGHPVAVARLVSSVTGDVDAICAAFLHDTIEDTSVTFDDIRDAGFGFNIAKLVLELTDVSKPSDGNRAARKSIDLDHLSGASDKAKTVKLADLIDNSKSIIEHGGGFAVVYMKEKRSLLDVLIGGNDELHRAASKIVNDFFDNKGY